MRKGEFDGDMFFAALDAQRQARGLNWKTVARESGVSASTLTRMSQGRRPDVDSMAALITWSGLNAESFIRHNDNAVQPEPLAQITVLLRADRSLSREGVIAMEAVLKATYERLKGA
jgi:transcriptional regulator with XRE-family HTH domain